MMSLTCKTAVKAVIYLASKRDSGEKSSIREIADFIVASEHTVGKLLQTLVKKELINSSKGPTGGFYISSAQYRKPIIRIIEAIDGKDIFTECGLGLKKCSSSQPCPIHHNYKPIREGFEQMCREMTLSDLCRPMNIGLTFLHI